MVEVEVYPTVTWMMGVCGHCGTINSFKIDTGRAEYVKSDSRGYETISDNVHIHFISVQNYSENLIRHSPDSGRFFSYLGLFGLDKGRKFKTKFADSILHEQLSIFVHVSALIKSNNTDITISEIDKLINIDIFMSFGHVLFTSGLMSYCSRDWIIIPK